MRDFQKKQPEADEHTESDIEQRDGQQIAADAIRGFADGLRGDGEMRAAGQPQHLVAHLFPVLQKEKDEHHHEECRRDKLDGRSEILVLIGDISPVRNHAHFEIGALLLVDGRRLRDALERPLDQRERAAFPLFQKTELLFDFSARGRYGELLRDVIELLRKPPAAEAESRHDQSE